MAQSCDKYSKTSLMGNWWEERQFPPQPFRENIQNKNLREEDVSISIPVGTNQLKPLSRIPRNQPWDTKGIVMVDDGFREFRSNHSTQIDGQTLKNYYQHGDKRPTIKIYGEQIVYPENSKNHMQTSKANRYELLNQDNLKKVTQSYNVPQNTLGKHTSDFGSTFKKHDLTHQQFFDNTAHHNAYQKPMRYTVQGVIQYHEQNISRYAGINERPQEEISKFPLTNLTGEQNKNEIDPKDNTAVQRSWLNHKDKVVPFTQKYMETNIFTNTAKGTMPSNPMISYKKNNTQNLNYDIQTSLNLGDGEYALQRQYKNPGEYRHIRTDITRIMNNVITQK